MLEDNKVKLTSPGAYVCLRGGNKTPEEVEITTPALSVDRPSLWIGRRTAARQSQPGSSSGLA